MPDQGPSTDDLAALRHRAFSRDGTEEDRRRLAEAEARALAPESTVADEPAVDERPASPAEPQDGDPAPVPWVRRIPLGWVAAGIAIGVLLTVGVASALPAAPRPEPTPTTSEYDPFGQAGESPLAVFQTAPTDRDVMIGFDPATLMFGGLKKARVRWLGETVKGDVYAVYGTRGKFDEPVVCLLAGNRDGGYTASCTDFTAFTLQGLTLDLSGYQVKWGPVGTDLWVRPGG